MINDQSKDKQLGQSITANQSQKSCTNAHNQNSKINVQHEEKQEKHSDALNQKYYSSRKQDLQKKNFNSQTSQQTNQTGYCFSSNNDFEDFNGDLQQKRKKKINTNNYQNNYDFEDYNEDLQQKHKNKINTNNDQNEQQKVIELSSQITQNDFQSQLLDDEHNSSYEAYYSKVSQLALPEDVNTEEVKLAVKNASQALNLEKQKDLKRKYPSRYCEICDTLKDTQEQYNLHTSRLHDFKAKQEGIKKLFCSNCGKSYDRQSYLQAHFSTCTGRKKVLGKLNNRQKHLFNLSQNMKK